MKFIVIFSSLLAALASAAVKLPAGAKIPGAAKLPATGVFISVRQQDQFGSTTLTVPYGILTKIDNSAEAGLELVVAFVEGIPVSEKYIVCQAFKDVAGTIFLGHPFGKNAPTPISNTAFPARIGSIFCADRVGVVDRINKVNARRTHRPAAP